MSSLERELKIGDIEIFFKSKIHISYKEELDRLFFFNGNQARYTDIVEQSIRDYDTPVLKEYHNNVAIVFDNPKMGQTLHIMDSNGKDAELLGVILYTRESHNTITIVHFVLHEQCNIIFKKSRINIALVVLEQLFSIFKKLKGVNQVKIYYTNRVISL